MVSSSTSASDRPAAEVLALPDSIRRYFETANAGEFEKTAALFASNGELVPPFEKPVVGRDAIAHYLTTEATGMEFTPLKYEQGEADNLEDETNPSDPFHRSLVRGKVKTAVFTVNVAWEFALNEDQEIISVRVKLLAKLNELLRLKS